MPTAAPSTLGSPTLNLCVLSGRLASAPVARTLPSGTTLLQLEVTVARAGERADSVPVAMFDPPAAVVALAAGAPVVVLGRVQRRFFRAGGATQSRTQVTARRVLPTTHQARVARLVESAVADLAAVNAS